MASQLTPVQQSSDVGPDELLYKGINPEHIEEDGTLLSGVFVFKKQHTLEQGSSVGLAKLITVEQLLEILGASWGVGDLQAQAVLDLSLKVLPCRDEKWVPYEHAHAVITDYQKLSDKARTDAARALRTILQERIRVKPRKEREAKPPSIESA